MNRRRGVTLLELLLVMAVLGIVLGAGLGIFASLDLGSRQARGLVKNVLRSAQNSAIVRRAPARVRIDRENGLLVAEAMQVIGTWHFERRTLRGAFQLEGGKNGGARFVEDGFLGDALAFDGRIGSFAQIAVRQDPAFDFHDGFAIDCALRKEGAAGGRVVTVGGVAGIDVTGAGAIRGWFAPRVELEGRPQKAARVQVKSEPGLLVGGEWVRVRLEYDRHRLTLYADGLPLDSVLEEAPVWPLEGPLLLSDRRYPLTGSLDNLVISAVVASEIAELPDTVVFPPDTPAEVLFDAGGGLNRERHPQPVLIHLDYEDGTRDSLLVGVYGTVDG